MAKKGYKISKVTSGDEGGVSQETYLAYIFPKLGNRNRILVLRKTVDTWETPAIMNKDVQQFFHIVEEISI